MPENNQEIQASAQLAELLSSLQTQDALWEEINQGPDANERMSAEAAKTLERLNALGWQAEWQKKAKAEEGPSKLFVVSSEKVGSGIMATRRTFRQVSPEELPKLRAAKTPLFKEGEFVCEFCGAVADAPGHCFTCGNSGYYDTVE